MNRVGRGGNGGRRRRASGNDELMMGTESALKCPMCLEPFETPRALACLHTFCEPCLGFYLTDSKASSKDGKLDKIECPICGHFTVPINVMKHPHAMVKDLPLNHYILPHLDSVLSGGRNSHSENSKKIVNFTKACGSCSERGLTREALEYCHDCEDFQCKECVDNHSKIKMLLSHRIVAMKGITSGPQSANAFDKHNRCMEHQTEEARFYCPEHDMLLCSLCVMASHKACELVNEFEDMGMKLQENGETEKLDDNMKNLQKALNDMIGAIRANNYGIKRESEEIPKRIQTVKAKVLRMFKNLEDDAEKKIQEFQDEYGKRNADKTFKCKQLLASIEGSSVSLDTARKHGTTSQMCRTFLKLKYQLQQYDELVKSEKNSLMCSSIKLKTDEALDKIVSATDQLGELYVESMKPDLEALPPLLFAKPEVAEPAMTPQLLKAGNIKIADVNITKQCIAADYLDKNLALVIEVKNRTWFSYTFALINADTLEEIHTQDLKKDPKYLVSIDSNNLAIPFPSSSFIEFYLYTPKRKKKPLSFTLNHTIKCDIREAVITKYDATHFGLSTRNYFATLTHDGVITRAFYYSVSLKSLESNFWSTQLNVDQIAVDIKRKRVYVACSKPYKLYSFTIKGEVMFEYNLNGNIRHLDLDKDGVVCVCTGSERGGVVHQISPNTGKLLQDVAIETKNPSLSCFNKNGNDFFVISHESQKISLEKYRIDRQDEEELFSEDNACA